MYDLNQQTASLCQAIAEEIRHVSHLVEEIANVLVCDEDVAMKHIDRLQSFDLVVQRASESARLLDRMAEGMPSHHAIDEVCLEEFQQRLRARIEFF